jgi:hypothetical protein
MLRVRSLNAKRLTRYRSGKQELKCGEAIADGTSLTVGDASRAACDKDQIVYGRARN